MKRVLAWKHLAVVMTDYLPCKVFLQGRNMRVLWLRRIAEAVWKSANWSQYGVLVELVKWLASLQGWQNSQNKMLKWQKSVSFCFVVLKSVEIWAFTHISLHLCSVEGHTPLRVIPNESKQQLFPEGSWQSKNHWSLQKSNFAIYEPGWQVLMIYFKT